MVSAQQTSVHLRNYSEAGLRRKICQLSLQHSQACIERQRGAIQPSGSSRFEPDQPTKSSSSVARGSAIPQRVKDTSSKADKGYAVYRTRSFRLCMLTDNSAGSPPRIPTTTTAKAKATATQSQLNITTRGIVLTDLPRHRLRHSERSGTLKSLTMMNQITKRKPSLYR
jgi:hypothetical protein